MQKNRKHVRFLCEAALIAAIYVVLTYLCAAIGMSSGAIQLRFSEALCVMAIFTPAAVPGMALGCFMANLLTGCALWDIVFGSLATLIGAIGARAIRKYRWLSPIPTILSNAIIVAFVIALTSIPEDPMASVPMLMLTVGIGEVISCGVFGTALICVLERYDSIKKLFTI